MTTLTPTEWNTLTYIQRYEREQGNAPRVREVMAGCGLEREELRQALSELKELHLVCVFKKIINNTSIVYARSNCEASGVVGVAFPERGVEHGQR